MMNYPNQNCYKFWKLAKSLKIDDIVALWCDIEPSQFNHFQRQTGYTPSCADAKRVVLEDALTSGELDYIDEGTPYNGGLWIGNPVEELIQKDCLRIEKTELKEWFIKKYESGELDEIPTFLDEEKQKSIALQNERADKPLPIPNIMGTREKHTAIKIMYALLIKSGLDNTYPTSKNRGSANCELQTLLDGLELTVGNETIGKFLDEVKELANQHPYIDTSNLPKNNIPF